MIAAVYALAIGFGIALFSGSIPGLGGHVTDTVALDGHQYATYEYYIPPPIWGNNSTSPSSVLFDGITFWVWVTAWNPPFSGFLHGNGTEANGTAQPFVLGWAEGSANRSTLYLSPDDRFGAAWNGQSFLMLLVELPASTGAT